MRNMELISHHQPEEFRKGRKETPRVRPLPRIPLASIHLGWAMRVPPGKTELEWLARGHLETNPITIKPKTASHGAEQFSWVPLPSCSPPGCPFPIKSLALSAHVSPRTIHFRMLDKSTVSGPGRGPPFLQHVYQCRRHKRCWFNSWVRKIPWRRKWQPSPVFLPVESHGQRNLVGYGP